MDKNIFTNDTVADFFDKHFVCGKFDGEKGDGLALVKKYGIQAYPTYIFLDSKGGQLHVSVGATHTGHEFIEQGQIALDPSKNYKAMTDRYEKGDRNPAFMKSYLDMLKKAEKNDDIILVANGYLSKLPIANYATTKTWEVLNYVTDPLSMPGLYIVRNQAKLKKVAGDSAVDLRVNILLGNPCFPYLMWDTKKQGKPDAKKLDALITLLQEVKYKDADKFLPSLLPLSYYSKGDFNGMLKCVQTIWDNKQVKGKEFSRLGYMYKQMEVMSESTDKVFLKQLAEYLDKVTAAETDKGFLYQMKYKKEQILKKFN
jgi:hypothetical protein